jgi:hypothetical protein
MKRVSLGVAFALVACLSLMAVFHSVTLTQPVLVKAQDETPDEYVKAAW